MSLAIITGIAIAAVIAQWAIYTRRKLLVLDENIRNAMSQIGVQLSSRFDALTALLNLTKGYSEQESEVLLEVINARRNAIMATSTTNDVMCQEEVISEVLDKMTKIIEQYPELKGNPNYIRAIGAVELFGNMVRTSRLIYNDSVTKLNHEIRKFPVFLIAGILGFRQKKYLEEYAHKVDIAGM